MKLWEWCAWAALSLIAFIAKALMVFGFAFLGAGIGFAIYVAWEAGALWVVPAVAIAFFAAVSGVVGAASLYEHLDRKRESRVRR